MKLTPEAVAAYSPRFNPPRAAPPLVCAVGGDESEEFLDQQREFLADWRGAGLEITEIPLPGCDHFAVVDAFAQAGHPLLDATLAMIES